MLKINYLIANKLLTRVKSPTSLTTCLVALSWLISYGCSFAVLNTYKYIEGVNDKIPICVLFPSEELYSSNPTIEKGFAELPNIFANGLNKSFKTKMFNPVGACPEKSSWGRVIFDADAMTAKFPNFIVIDIRSNNKVLVWTKNQRDSSKNKQTKHKQIVHKQTKHDIIANLVGVDPYYKAEGLSKQDVQAYLQSKLGSGLNKYIGTAVTTMKRKLIEVVHKGKGAVHIKFGIYLLYYKNKEQKRSMAAFDIDTRLPVQLNHTQAYTITLEEFVNMTMTRGSSKISKRVLEEKITDFLLIGSYGRKGSAKDLIGKEEKEALKNFFTGNLKAKSVSMDYKDLFATTIPLGKNFAADFSKQLKKQIDDFKNREHKAYQESKSEK